MPRGDHRGPNGLGPMTGRGMGFCAGRDEPGFTHAGWGHHHGFGRGFDRGFGRGFGRGRGPGRRDRPHSDLRSGNPTAALEAEIVYLERELEILKSEKDALDAEATEGNETS
jgi:hypothetical protein